MRKDFGSKPMLYPMPVLIIGTYGEDGTPNAMNAAWGGIVDTNLIGICLADHKTTRGIFARKAFTRLHDGRGKHGGCGLRGHRVRR